MNRVNQNKKQIIDVNLNLNVRGLDNSATLLINEQSNQLIREGKEVFKLGLGQSPFPVPALVQEALRQNAHQKDYLPVKGLPELREAVAEYYKKKHKINRLAQDIMVGPGSKELLFILQLVYYGDLVIPTPSWVSYSPQARIIGRHVQWVETHPENSWRLTPEVLEALCTIDPNRPRIVILNYPANPTGSTYAIEKLKAIAEVARKYRVILLSDEIYGELHFQGQHVSVARYYPEGTIISGGLSKWCGAGGWRLGVFSFPRELQWLMDPMASVASETYTSTSAPIQYAAVSAYRGDDSIETYLYQSRRILKALSKKISNVLTTAKIKHPKPEGAFYFFADFCEYREDLMSKGIFTSAELCSSILEDTGVAVLPGSSFGRPANELTVRIAYVDFNGEEVLKAAYNTQEIDDEFIDKYCPRVLQALERLCNWITAI